MKLAELLIAAWAWLVACTFAHRLSRRLWLLASVCQVEPPASEQRLAPGARRNTCGFPFAEFPVPKVMKGVGMKRCWQLAHEAFAIASMEFVPLFVQCMPVRAPMQLPSGTLVEQIRARGTVEHRRQRFPAR